MKLEDAIRIYDLREDRNITPNKLATLSGMPAGSLKSIFYGKAKILALELCSIYAKR